MTLGDPDNCRGGGQIQTEMPRSCSSPLSFSEAPSLVDVLILQPPLPGLLRTIPHQVTFVTCHSPLGGKKPSPHSSCPKIPFPAASLHPILMRSEKLSSLTALGLETKLWLLFLEAMSVFLTFPPTTYRGGGLLGGQVPPKGRKPSPEAHVPPFLSLCFGPFCSPQLDTLLPILHLLKASSSPKTQF